MGYSSKEARKAYRERNKDKIKQYAKRYYEKVKADPEKAERMRAKSKEYHIQKMASDPEYRHKKVATAKIWQKNNKDKHLVIKQRYYNSPHGRAKTKATKKKYYKDNALALSLLYILKKET